MRSGTANCRESESEGPLSKRDKHTKRLKCLRETCVPPILLTIDALYDSADACPPLKSAVGAIRAIISICMVRQRVIMRIMN